MDRITKNLLAEFSKENALEGEREEDQFEHFAGFLATRRHYNRALDTEDIVTGQGGDTGIDSIAIIVNGVLITDIDQIRELEEQNGYIDAFFIFTQSERSAAFDAGKIGKFGFGVLDFFSDKPQLVRNERIGDAAAIMNSIYERSSSFRKRPLCHLYYVTTGKTTDDQNIKAQYKAVILQLDALKIFERVDFNCFGADEVLRLYNQSKKAISREFVFEDKVEIPSVPGVEVAFLGYIPAKVFVGLISNDAGDSIVSNIFYDNVRDWQDYNPVNSEMRTTLLSENKARFVLMNNGVTIIAKKLKQSGKKFFIDDFQIVNGCQTSHVLFDQRLTLDDSVWVPLKLIEASNDDVIEAIVLATNRQTELKPEQLYALTDFAKKLESFFAATPEGDRLYYERRDGQYDKLPVEKSKIVTPSNLVKAFASMFLSEPHIATKNYKKLRDEIGVRIFNRDHRLEPYHVAALAAYKLHLQFKSKKLSSEYKSARHHILMTLRLLIDNKPVARMNSNEMTKRCKVMSDSITDVAKFDALIQKAKKIIDEVSKGDLGRDNIRTQPTTEAILNRLERN